MPGRPSGGEEGRPRRRISLVRADAEFEGVAGRVPDEGLRDGVVILDGAGAVLQALALYGEVLRDPARPGTAGIEAGGPGVLVGGRARGSGEAGGAGRDWRGHRGLNNGGTCAERREQKSSERDARSYRDGGYGPFHLFNSPERLAPVSRTSCFIRFIASVCLGEVATRLADRLPS